MDKATRTKISAGLGVAAVILGLVSLWTFLDCGHFVDDHLSKTCLRVLLRLLIPALVLGGIVFVLSQVRR